MSESLTGPGLLAGIKANSIVSAKLKYVVLSDLIPKIHKIPPWGQNLPPGFGAGIQLVASLRSSIADLVDSFLSRGLVPVLSSRGSKG